MSKVQIDDYECEQCNKTVFAELDTATKTYKCSNCNMEE